MSPNRLKVLLVGTGWWGQILADALSSTGVMELVGVVTPGAVPVALEGVAAWTELSEALAGPEAEAVILATPHGQHAAQIEMVAAAGKHVFCEKPLTLSVEEAKKAVAACREAGVVLGVGFQRRVWPSFAALRRLVIDGALGELCVLEGNYSNNTDVGAISGAWRRDPAQAPGAPGLTGMAIHPLDQMVSLVGALDTVEATCTRASVVNLRFASGAVGSLSWMEGTPEFYRFAVFGTKGWAELTGPREGRWKAAGGAVELLPLRSTELDPIAENLRRFAIACQGDGVWPVSADELVETVDALLRVASACHQSLDGVEAK